MNRSLPISIKSLVAPGARSQLVYPLRMKQLVLRIDEFRHAAPAPRQIVSTSKLIQNGPRGLLHRAAANPPQDCARQNRLKTLQTEAICSTRGVGIGESKREIPAKSLVMAVE